MKIALRAFLILLTAAAAVTACYPTTGSLQASTRPTKAATAPALRSVPTQSYPAYPGPYPGPYPTLTGTPLPLPDYYPGPPPADDAAVTPQLSEIDSFLATRAAELHVPELQGDDRIEAFRLFEGTRQAALWQDLDEEQLHYLALAWEPIVQLQPGESHQFEVGFASSVFRSFPAEIVQASWRISPTAGAAIDPQTGLFTVDENTPPGTVYTVTADVQNGRVSPTIDVYIYTLEENPLVGRWQEEKQITCTAQEQIVPDPIMEELKFNADGTFTAAWIPFETYRDYVGTYDYDKTTGELRLTIERGGYIPPDIDGAGYALVDENQKLILTDMWLGTPQNAASRQNCGHVFFRFDT